MKRGDLFWIQLPDQKKRPAVILSPNFLIDVRDRVLVAPCTSQRIDEIAHTEVLLDRDLLPKPTKVQCQDMGTFRKKHFEEKIRSLTEHEVESLNQAVEIVTGLWDQR
jgi:mRNA-degrading endonuclease toxin of MazEF toxin-antitoxin module